MTLTAEHFEMAAKNVEHFEIADNCKNVEHFKMAANCKNVEHFKMAAKNVEYFKITLLE